MGEVYSSEHKKKATVRIGLSVAIEYSGHIVYEGGEVRGSNFIMRFTSTDHLAARKTLVGVCFIPMPLR